MCGKLHECKIAWLRKTLEIGGHFLVPFIVRLTQTDKRRCDILIEYEAWDICGLVDSRE